MGCYIEIGLVWEINYKVPGPANGLLEAGHKGSEELRGMHMGKPENDVILGETSSAVMNGEPV